MFCTNICLLALIFIVTKIIILFTITLPYSKIHKVFNESLDDMQRTAYKKIISERRRIYIMGYIAGIVLSVAIILINLFVIKKNKLSALCLAVVVSSITTYLAYILHPKSKYMLQVIETKEQINNWLSIYKSMQFRFHISFLLGVVATALGHYSFC